MNLEELRAELKKLEDARDAILAKYEDDDAELTDEDQTSLNDTLDAIDALQVKIRKVETMQAARGRAAEQREASTESTGRITKPSTPGSDIGEVRERREEDESHGYETFESFCRDVRSASSQGALMSDRLLQSQQIMSAPTTYGQEAVGADGGFAVPPAFANRIWSLVFDDVDSVLSRIGTQPTASNNVVIPTDETTPWGSTGIIAEWLAEGSQLTQRKPVLKELTVKLYKLGVLAPVTEELLQDAPLLESHLTTRAAEAIRYKASDSLVNGTGAGQPLGFFIGSSLVSQAKEGSQTADTINANNVAKMYGRMRREGGLGNSFWLINPDAFNQLPTMTVGDQPVWQADFRQAPGGVLFGLPVIMSEHCQTLGNQGDIYLVNGNGYAAYVKSQGIRSDASMHLFFDYDQTAFRFIFRIGGAPYLSAAVTPPNSAITQSHFVTLDARA